MLKGNSIADPVHCFLNVSELYPSSRADHDCLYLVNADGFLAADLAPGMDRFPLFDSIRKPTKLTD